MMTLSAAILSLISIVHVKVFPHDGPYSIPQGLETRQDRVQVHSEGDCELSTPRGKLTGKSFTVAALDFLQGSGKLECKAPITVLREGAKAYSYRGHLTFHHEKGKLLIVNTLTFNDYLKGVVPAEMSASWHMEALKAQAIAARTYAANQILQARAQNPQALWDMDDTVQYQAYSGFGVERVTTSEAIEATKDVFLLDKKGRPIIAYFSADSGGYTESNDNIWGGKPLSYTVSKPEVYDLRLIKSAWTSTLTLAEMTQKMIGRGVVKKDFKLAHFEILETTPSGRMKRVRIVSEAGEDVELPGERFRYGLAFRSSLLTVKEVEAGKFQFDGLGYGHGVGMNQTGAKVLAESLGWDHKQILEFYYEGINL